jgi:hypothetical protein
VIYPLLAQLRVAPRGEVYLRVIAGILPKDVQLKVQSLDDLTDDQLMRKLASLTEMAKPLLAKVLDPELAGPARAGARHNPSRILKILISHRLRMCGWRSLAPPYRTSRMIGSSSSASAANGRPPVGDPLNALGPPMRP